MNGQCAIDAQIKCLELRELLCALFSLSLPLSRSGLDDHSTPFIFRSKRHYTLFICREWFICRNYFRLLQHTWFVLIASGRLPFDLHLINLQVCCL